MGSWGEGTEYYWVVLCKNRGTHNKYNLFFKHAIPLGEADEVSPPPKIEKLTVRCDECGQEDTYSAQDVLRAELEHLDSFIPHPLFQDLPLTGGDEISPIGTGKKKLIQRVRAAVLPYVRFRRKESPPPPRWRR